MQLPLEEKLKKLFARTEKSVHGDRRWPVFESRSGRIFFLLHWYKSTKN